MTVHCVCERCGAAFEGDDRDLWCPECEQAGEAEARAQFEEGSE